MSDEILELQLKEKDDKLQKENEAMKMEKSQENEAKSNTPPLKPMKRSHEEESSEQMNIEIKKPKLTAKSFLDGQILEFLKIVLPSIDSIFMHFRSQIHKWDEDNIRIGPIRRLLSILAPKTFALTLIDFGIDLCVLNRLFPGFIEEVQYIEMISIISEWDLLLKWLNTERADGESKLLLPFIKNEHENDIWDRIKKEFLLSKRRATFIIFIGRAFMEDQTIENEETGEVLSIYLSEETRDEDNDRVQFIVRHQKGMEYLRKNWEKRNSIIGNWGHEFTSVGVEIQEIGLF